MFDVRRLEKEGILLPYSDEAKAKLGYKPNTQESQGLNLVTGDLKIDTKAEISTIGIQKK